MTKKKEERIKPVKKQITAVNLPMGLASELAKLPPMPEHGYKIAVIPDVQAMPGVPMEHLTWAGQYLCEKRPDIIVCIGDFGDFPSLSRWGQGQGHASWEGRRYTNDLNAFHEAMQLFLTPIRDETAATGWDPTKIFTLGNHEAFIDRFVEENPVLTGHMSLDDLKLPEYGWQVFEFMQPVNIAGTAFCHFFPSGIMGRPITAARTLLSRLHMSAFAGHQQGRMIDFAKRADGTDMTAIISGSFYQHEYDYLSPFTNKHWRGMYMLHEVKGGSYDEMPVSIDFLRRRFT
jgi:hypothetical protein